MGLCGSLVYVKRRDKHARLVTLFRRLHFRGVLSKFEKPAALGRWNQCVITAKLLTLAMVDDRDRAENAMMEQGEFPKSLYVVHPRHVSVNRACGL